MTQDRLFGKIIKLDLVRELVAFLSQH